MVAGDDGECACACVGAADAEVFQGYRPKSVYGPGVSGVFSCPSLSEFDAVFVGEAGVVFCGSDGFVGLCVGVWFWWVPVGFGDEVPGVFG